MINSNEDYVNINRNAYNKLASEYEFRINHKGQYQETAKFLASLPLKHINPNSHAAKALEIGPGSGEVLREFERYGLKTIAVDVSEELLKIARNVSPQTLFINQNILQVEFMPNQFDIIFAGALIHLFPYKDAVLLFQNLNRWIKNEGVIFINTTLNETSEEGLQEKTDYKTQVVRFRKLWTESELIETVSINGFSIIEKAYTNEIDRNKKWLGLVIRKKL